VQALKRQYEQLERSKQETGSVRLHELQRQVSALTDQRTLLGRETSDLEGQCRDLRKENSRSESRLQELRQRLQAQGQAQGDAQSLHAGELEALSTRVRDLTFQAHASRKTIDEVSDSQLPALSASLQ
jgi:predicted  nucleic acid-binding Zn-ribbon protein